MKREDVYKVIDSERDYQDTKWGGAEHDSKHSVGDFLVYMRNYLTQAEKAYSTELDATGALNALRKVTALGVACMEHNPTEKRF